MAMRRVILLSFLLISLFFSCATTNDQKDKEECTEQLVGLATCLQYVGGNAKSPTPDCCNGLKQLLKTNRKCLCVIVKDRNDPDLGLDINVTLALGLPSVCHAPANVSQCPALLHLAPNSADAQVFYQFDRATISGATKANSTSSSSSGASSLPQKNYGGGNEQRRQKLKLQLVILVGILVWLNV
ncbi:non-specific lipid transfer protein GPI-anchored 14-like isoform X2 [Apium graveolens]|uniref:non-specific lipid transfer protein GPI-anchored 14-like isoform X2 n=1 Tax=Apium graveolens TaxID=4045 RepID=UPI003D7AEA44